LFRYAHKDFLQDLINEWVKDAAYSDQSHFVPFTYSFDAKVDDLQLTLPCNDKNWIDTSSQAEENCHLAIEVIYIIYDHILIILIIFSGFNHHVELFFALPQIQPGHLRHQTVGERGGFLRQVLLARSTPAETRTPIIVPRFRHGVKQGEFWSQRLRWLVRLLVGTYWFAQPSLRLPCFDTGVENWFHIDKPNKILE